MINAYGLMYVLQRLSPDMLSEYCRLRLNKSFIISGPENTTEELANRFIKKVYESLTPKQSTDVEVDLQLVEEMATQGAFLTLKAHAEFNNSDIPQDDLEAMKSAHDRAMWFYLHRREIFDEASVWYEVKDRTGWQPFPVGQFDLDALEGHETELSMHIGEYLYRTQWRGRRCHVECYIRDGQICYVAYPEDYAEKDVEYNEKNQLDKHLSRRSVFRVYFLYDPEENTFRTKVKGGKHMVQELQKIFAKDVFTLDIDPTQTEPFNFDVLKNFDFEFPVPAEDNVEFIKVKQLQMSYPGSRGKRIILGAFNDDPPYYLGSMKQMTDEDCNIDLDQIEIKQATIQIKFAKPGKWLRGSVTAQLTHPNSCNLKETKWHRKVRRYLCQWGIIPNYEHGQTIKSSNQAIPAESHTSGIVANP